MKARTCQTCRCFDVCDRCSSFAKQMVFSVRRIDIELIDFMAANCKSFVPAEDLQQIQSEEEPLLYAINGGMK